MKVLLATDTFAPAVNGIAVFTHKLAEDLGRSGHEVSVVAPAWPRYPRVEATARYAVHRIASLPVLLHPYTRLSPFFTLGSARELLGRIGPDVVHVQTPWLIGAATAAGARRLGLPVAGTHHVRPENFLPYLPSLLHPLLSRCFWRHVESVYAGLDLVTVPSETGRALLLLHTRIRQVEVVSNGVDLEYFRPAGPSCATPSRRQDGRDRPLILYVGRVDRDKGVDLLLAVLSSVLRQTDADAAVCGTGSELGWLRARLDEVALSDRVALPGWVRRDELPEWYRRAAVLVMTGEGETQPIVALEAMACGLPIVGIKSPGLQDVVIDGATGALVGEGAAAPFVEAVLRIVRDVEHRERLGRGARACAERLHSSDRTTAWFVERYQQLAHAPPNRATTPTRVGLL